MSRMTSRRRGSRRRFASGAVAEALESRLFLHHGPETTHYHFQWTGGPGNWRDTSHWVSDRPSHLPPSAPTPNDTIAIGASAGEVIVSAFDTFAFHSGIIYSNIRLESGALLIAHGNNVTLNGTMTFVGTGPTRFQIYAAQGGAGTFDGSGTITTENGRAFISSRFGMTIGSGLTFNYGANGGNIDGSATFLGTMNIDGGLMTTGVGGIFTNRGTINLNNGQFQLNGQGWTNQGLINHNGGTLYLGGTWRQSDLGANVGRYIRTGGTVTAAGTLLGDLTLDAKTGSWNGSGTLRNGRFTTREGATFSSASTWDNYTLASNLTPIAGTTTILNNLTLDGTTLRVNSGVTLRALSTTGTSLNPSLIGAGTLELNNGTLLMQNVINGNQDFTIGPDIHTTVLSAGSYGSQLASQKYVLRGPIATTASGQNIAISARQVDVYADISLVSGSFLFIFDASGTLNFLEGSSITTSSRSVFESARGFNLSSTDRGRTLAPGTYDMRGGTAAVPKLLEVAGKDLGPVSKGFLGSNFGIGVLRQNGAGLRLVDDYDNSPGFAEALYVDSLFINQSSYALDLNGKTLYARAMQLNGGSIINGSVVLVPDGGPLEFALPTSGRINAAGELDDWTFFGRAGQKVSIVHNPSGNATGAAPGALSPILSQGKATLLAPGGATLVAGQSAGQNGVVTLSNIVLPEDGTYTIRAQASAAAASNTGHYKLSLYDVSVRRHPLLLNRDTTGNIDTPFAVDEWTFSLSAGQQIQFDLLNSANAGLRYTLEGPNGYVPFSNISGDSGLITIPGGNAGNYVLRVQGVTDETGAYNFLVRDTSVTTLTLGTPYAGNLPGSGSPQWFKVNLPSSGQLVVTLDDSTNSDRNELYLRRGATPSRSEYDYRFSTFDADETIYVPNASPGDWYVLVYGAHVPAASNYTLKAEYSDLRVTSNTPDRYGVENTMTMTLTGGGFEPGTTVSLVGGANTINATTVEIDSFTQLTATFDLSGALQRTWDVLVERGAVDFTRPGAFQTLPNAPAELDLQLHMPGSPTRTSVTTGYIEYANTGNVAMPAPLFILQSADPEGDEFPILSLDLTRSIENFWSTVLPPGTSHRIMVLGSGAVPGMLNPGERMKVPYNYLGEKAPFSQVDNNLELEVLCVHSDGAHGEDEQPMDWDSLKQPLQSPGVPNAIWDQVYANITAPLNSVQDYAAALVANAQYLGRLGLRDVDVDDLWNFEVLKALGAITAFPTLASAVEAQLAAPGSPLTFSRRFDDGVISRNKLGPFGYGWSVPWMATLSRGPNDDILTITTSTGGQRAFVRDDRGSTPGSPSGKYFSAPGDPTKIRRVSSGIYELSDAGGNVTRFLSDGRINYVQDANGNRTTAGYNAAGRLVTLTHSSGAVINLGYNSNERISLLTDSLGHSVTYTYDAAGEHLLSATQDDGTTATYTYDDSSSNLMRRHALLTETSFGETQIFTYDAQGRIASSSLAGGAQLVNVSYSFGRVTLSDAAGTGQVYFDHRLRMAQVTNARGYTTRMSYDANNRLSSVILPDGNTQSYTWCSCGALTSATDELGQTTRFGLDPITRKATSITDPKGNVTRMTYDSFGNQLQLIHADGIAAEVAGNHTATGLPQSFTNRRGQTSTYTYNSAGQVTLRTAPDGTTSQKVYDTRGRLTNIGSPANFAILTYDTAVDGDRVKKIAFGSKFIEYDYDAEGRRIATRDWTGYTTRFDYDAAGRLSHVRDAANAALATYIYDAAGRLTRIDNGNGTFTTYSYDAAGNVLSIQNWRSTSTLNSSFTYTYDSRDRRITATSAEGTWTYGYDPTDQLISATFASTSALPGQNIQISYDAVGNRTFANINGDLIDYAVNALNQYTQVDGANYTYDADGNLLSDGTHQFTYDELNRLTQIQSGSDVQQFQYNAFGDRKVSILNGVATNYLVAPDAGGRVLTEFDSSDAITSRNIFGAGLLGRTIGAAGGINYFDFDATGSTVGVSDAASGAYLNQYAYSPFGEALSSVEGIANPYEFIGRYGVRADIGGVSHMGFREYSTADGRFTSIDPLRFKADSNTYRYAENSPTLKIDPLGLFFVRVFGDALGGELWEMAYSSTVDAFGNVAQGDNVDAGGVASSFALNAGLAFPGAAGFANAFSVAMKPEVYENFTSAACGLAYQREFGSLNRGAAKQLAALDAETGGGGVPNINPACLDGFPQSGDVDMGIGDPCAFGSRSLWPRPWDPNDKFGPAGFGPENRVPIENAIAYTVDFENLGPGSEDENGNPYAIVATVPAQRVAISDQLSSHVDWSSVEFTEFQFGDTVVPVTNGLGSFHTIVPSTTEDGVQFIVEINAEVDLGTGVLSVILQALDPDTGLPPAPLVGVLPPEDGSHNGMGHFKFTVNPLPTVPDGTQIRNIALIRFDSNEVIATNQINPLDPSAGTSLDREALVTIDAIAPSVVAGPTFLFDADSPRVSIQFNEDVETSLMSENIVIENLTNSSFVVPVPIAYEQATQTAMIDLGAALPDGNYHLTIQGLMDGVGHPLAEEIELSFFFLNADANRDRFVDTLDFNILAGNFNASGASFSQGDFNFDETIDSLDFNTLVAKYGTRLPAPATALAHPAAAQAAPLFGNVAFTSEDVDAEELDGSIASRS